MQDYILDLFDRVNVIKDTIKKYGEDKFYLSFSGGKDSTVLSKLIDMAVPGNQIPRVFMNTGLEMVSIVKFVKNLAISDPRIVIVNSTIPVRKSLEEFGYPIKNKEFSKYADLYWRHGITKSTAAYLSYTGPGCVPKKFRYIFTPSNKIHFSDKCCEIRKEKPLWVWAREHKKTIALIALVGGEGGRRDKFSKSNGKIVCFTSKSSIQNYFYPLRKVDEEFVNAVVKNEKVQLCELYYPPFNFCRTGCKGCPFTIDLQRRLDLLERYFPAEYAQCMTIWKPVYDVYVSLNYRIKDKEQLKLF